MGIELELTHRQAVHQLRPTKPVGPDLQLFLGWTLEGEQLEGKDNPLQIKSLPPFTANDHHPVGAVAVGAGEQVQMPRVEALGPSSHPCSCDMVTAATVSSL
jgi:hypothetical protein